MSNYFSKLKMNFSLVYSVILLNNESENFLFFGYLRTVL